MNADINICEGFIQNKDSRVILYLDKYSILNIINYLGTLGGFGFGIK